MTHKKAQVTLFIIIGLLITIVGGSLIYTYTQQQEQIADNILVPSEAQPFYEYITSCIAQVGEEGIRTLGERGGYIKPTFPADRVRPTEGEAVPLSPGSDLEIPYWHYMKSDNACQQGCQFSGHQPILRKPAATSIETQLEAYVTNALPTCLNNFAEFRAQQWNINADDNLKVTTTITEEGVAFYVNYPITFERNGKIINLDEYTTSLNVKLQELYTLGGELVDAQRRYNYIERAIFQLIALNQGLGAEQLPPGYEVKVSLNAGTFWVKRDIQEKVKGLMTSYIPLLQVFGTHNYKYLEAPAGVSDPALYESLYNRNMLVLPSLESYHPDIEARFLYLPWWEPYFDMNCNGELCQGENMLSTFIIPMGIQRYLFTYDLSFPVLVELKDPDAFNGRGFTFNYFIEANLRNSQPLTPTAEVIPAEQVSQTLFCEPNKRTGSTVRLNITNAKTKQRVSDASVVFSCGSGTYADRCALGQTTGDYFTIQLPKCLGGSLSVNREGYGSKSIPLDTDIEGTKTLNFALEPYRNTTLQLLRHNLKRDFGVGWHVEVGASSLSPYEEAVITLSRRTKDGEQPFNTVAYIFGNKIINEKQGVFRDIQLLPGVYDVQIDTFLYSQDPVSIMPQARHYKKGLFGEGTFMVPSEPITFNHKNPLPYGGAEFEWLVEPEDLDTSNTITLYTIDFALDQLPESLRIIEDLEQMGKVKEYSQSHRAYIEPTFRQQ